MQSRNSIITLAVFAIMCIATSLPSFGQSDRYSLTLNSQYITSLKNAGSLVSTIDDASRNRIGIIELRFTDTKDNEPVDIDINVENENDATVIVVDDDLLSKIKGQPVRIQVANPQFSRVLLKYDVPAISNDPAIEPGIAMDGDAVFIRLSDTKTMAGKLEAFESLKMSCAFGDITIPMDQIAGIKFHTTNDDQAVVVLSNGDSFTGLPSLPAIQLTTDWGQADIEPKYILSLTKTAGAKFQRANTDFGTRWNLNTGTSYAPSALTPR